MVRVAETRGNLWFSTTKTFRPLANVKVCACPKLIFGAGPGVGCIFLSNLVDIVCFPVFVVAQLITKSESIAKNNIFVFMCFYFEAVFSVGKYLSSKR